MYEKKIPTIFQRRFNVGLRRWLDVTVLTLIQRCVLVTDVAIKYQR